MRTQFMIGAAVFATTAIFLAPAANADPGPAQPNCTTVEGGTYTGTGTTECQTPGNVQLNETAPAPDYIYPWDDGFYGPVL